MMKRGSASSPPRTLLYCASSFLVTALVLHAAPGGINGFRTSVFLSYNNINKYQGPTSCAFVGPSLLHRDGTSGPTVKLHNNNKHNSNGVGGSLEKNEDKDDKSPYYNGMDVGRPYKFVPVLDQEGRAWRSNLELRETYGLTRSGMPYNSTERSSLPFRTKMGKHQIMLKGRAHSRFELDEERWMHRYDLLTRFYERYGHTSVPVEAEHDRTEEFAPFHQIRLGYWVVAQRREYRHRVRYEARTSGLARADRELAPPRMTDMRIALLDQLSFQWDPTEENWTAMYGALLDYKRQHHNSTHVKYRESGALGHWVGRQRTQLRYLQQGRPSTMTPTRRRLLDAIGFHWDGRPRDWEEYRNELAAYRDLHGDCRVPKNTYEPDPKLGHWVSAQRMERKRQVAWEKTRGSSRSNSTDVEDVYQHVYSVLTPARIRQLDALDFDWAIYTSWDDHYEELQRWQQQHGDCLVAPKYNRALSLWLKKQRSERNRGKLRDDRARRLESVPGFCWDPAAFRFDANVAKLRAFRAEHGHVRVPAKYAADPTFGTWVTNIKQEYRKLLTNDGTQKSRLTEERRRALDALGFRDIVKV